MYKLVLLLCLGYATASLSHLTSVLPKDTVFVQGRHHHHEDPDSPLINIGQAVKFYLYTRANVSDARHVVLNNVTLLQESGFLASRPTKFLIHGHMDNLNGKMIQSIKDALLAAYDVNVFCLDWSSVSDDLLYPIVVLQVPLVGQYVGEFGEFLIKNASVKAADIHLIGHNLGAHVAGLAGRTLAAGKNKPARISGLDPALPGFSYRNTKTRLTSTDAEFVDCIHTCGGLLGFQQAICDADYYPNGGTTPQNGCPIIDLGICSYRRAYEYYAESVNSTHVFNAQTCASMLFVLPIDCVNDGAVMGYPAGEKQLHGIFSLMTNDKYPFATEIN